MRHKVLLSVLEWDSFDICGDFEPRAWLSSCIVNNKAILFGGAVYRRRTHFCCNKDLIMFEPENRTFHQLDVGGSVVTPRASHTASLVGTHMYIVGGEYRDMGLFPVYRDIVSVFDLATMHWSERVIRGVPLGFRECHSATTVNDKIVVFGGATFDGNYHYFNDTNLFDCASSRWRYFVVWWRRRRRRTLL